MKKSLLSLLAISTFGLAFSQATYTDIDPDKLLTATYTGESYTIDMDNDGNIDFVFAAAKKDTTLTVPMTITGSAVTTMGNNAIVGETRQIIGNPVLIATRFGPGDTIVAGLPYITSNDPSVFAGVGMGVNIVATVPPLDTTFSDLNNDTLNFIGVKFDIGANTHYGWIRLLVDSHAATCTLESYGYNMTAADTSFAGDLGNGGFISVQEIENNAEIYAYENNLYVKGLDHNTITVYNVIGNKVISKKINGNTVISMGHLPKGVYLVNYQIGNYSFTKKVTH